MQILERHASADTMVRFAKMYPQTFADWMAQASEHVTIESPNTSGGTSYRFGDNGGYGAFFGPQGLQRDDLSARVGVEGLADYHPVEA